MDGIVTLQRTGLHRNVVYLNSAEADRDASKHQERRQDSYVERGMPLLPRLILIFQRRGATFESQPMICSQCKQ